MIGVVGQIIDPISDPTDEVTLSSEKYQRTSISVYNNNNNNNDNIINSRVINFESRRRHCRAAGLN